MNRKAYILAAILALTLSSIYFLPPFRQAESAMAMEIPETLGIWRTRTYPPSQKEREALAPDTRFSKAMCWRPRPGSWDFVTGRSEADVADVSIVLSGYDLANSIHRPERCMPTQGHQIYQSEKSALEVPGHGAIPVRRLLSYKKALIEGTKAETVQNALTVYFFVGNQVVTEDHTRRTLIDMADRLTKGEAQRWSYVSVTMLFNNEAQGAARMEGLPTLDEADRLARELLAELVSENLAWKQVLN